MNFISRMEGQEIQVELKYCERCGGLWLRPQRSEGIHCASCRVILAVRSKPEVVTTRKAGRRSPRPGGYSARKVSLHSAARIECLQGVATLEVRA